MVKTSDNVTMLMRIGTKSSSRQNKHVTTKNGVPGGRAAAKCTSLLRRRIFVGQFI